MRRHLLGYVIAFVGLGALAALAVTGDEPPADTHCVEVTELGVWVCGTTTTSTLASSTTSSQPTTTVTSSTTSTLPATTTTTEATTTTAPSSSDLVIPETIDYGLTNSQLDDGEGFEFRVGCDPENGTEDDPSDDFDCGEEPNNPGGSVWLDRFLYVGHGMPYLYDDAVEGNHDHGWWVNGDRENYWCAYGFLYDRHPNPFGELSEPREVEFIARATIVRPFGQSYGRINDGYMEEGERYYDGTLTGVSQQEIHEEDCQETALDDFDYDSYVPQGPDQIRVGLFLEDGQISDIRDFGGKEGHYEFLSFENGRVAIVRIEPALNQVSHVFYYDTLNSGRIAVEVNGTLIGG